LTGRGLATPTLHRVAGAAVFLCAQTPLAQGIEYNIPTGRRTDAMSLMDWIVLLFILAVVNLLLAVVQIWSFTSRTSTISNAQDLEDFKRLARRQMYQALGQLVFLVGAIGMSLYGLKTGQCNLLHVFGLSLAILATGLNSRPFEGRARSIPVEDESLAEEYAAICESWVKKPLPDF